MASLEDIVAATKILADDSAGGSGSKAGENRGRVSDINKDHDGSNAAKGVVEAASVLEFTSNSNISSTVISKEKIGVGNLNGAGDGVASFSGSGVDGKDDIGGSVDGFVGREKMIDDDDVSCMRNVGDDSKELEESGEKLDGEDKSFRVGDFVWGKIRSHPWWPGQVYDPKDASKFAVKHSQEGRLLVAFFGDGSCSWCLPSQLIPFVENFNEMCMDSSSRSFLNAVQSTVDEIGRLVECSMTCRCVSLEKRDGLARPMVANAGVKSGVLAPEVDIHRLPIPEYQPAEVLVKVINFAKAVSFDNMFELAVLRSWLSAFYRAKCGYPLPVYHEPVNIEGLEDNDDSETAVTNDFSVPIEVPIVGPQEEDWVSSPTHNSAKSQAAPEDKIYHRRKQKSVAELMGESSHVKPKSQKRASMKEGKNDGNSVSSSKRQKNNDGEVEEGDDLGGSKTGRKKRVEGSQSAKMTNDEEEPNEGSLVVKPEGIEVASPENASDNTKDEFENLPTPRERKKSKYLSPPYTNPDWRMGFFSGSKMEPQFDKTAKTDSAGKSTTRNLSASESDDKTTDEKLLNSRQKGLGAPDNTNARDDKKMTFPLSDVNVPTNEFLSEIRFGAVDCFYLSEKGSLDMVWAFISALRSATYLQGSDYRVYQKCKKIGRKRKSVPSRLGKQAKERAESPDLESPKAVKIERKQDTSDSKEASEKSDGSASTNLVLSFTPGFPLPSKEEIVRLYSKYGSLDEKETKVVTESHSVHIVFVKESDAEAAFQSSVSQSPFSIENVNYWLQRPRKRPAEEPTCDLISDVRVIKQKVDIMTAILENYHSRFSSEEKSSLKDEMKHLMEKVETASEKVRIMADKRS